MVGFRCWGCVAYFDVNRGRLMLLVRGSSGYEDGWRGCLVGRLDFKCLAFSIVGAFPPANL